MESPLEELRKPTGYILGAGFSRAISSHMPLTSDLTRLTIAKLKEQKDNDVSSILEKAPVTGDIELLLTYLAEQQPWLDVERGLRNRALFLNISKLIAEIIFDHQEKAIQEIVLTNNHWALDLIRAWMGRPSCVVSLNYDILVEQLFSIAFENSNYKDLFTTVVAFAPSRDGGARIAHEIQRLPMKLYKLHGSISWYYSGSESFFGETVYDSGLFPFQPSRVHDNLYDIFRSTNDKVPLLVPPTIHKESFFKNEFVRAQWRSSQNDLSQCEEIFTLGYSLPKSDVMMRFYLSEILKLPTFKTLYVVNTSDDVIDNYREAFKPYGEKLDFSLIRADEPIKAFFKSSSIPTTDAHTPNPS